MTKTWSPSFRYQTYLCLLSGKSNNVSVYTGTQTHPTVLISGFDEWKLWYL